MGKRSAKMSLPVVRSPETPSVFSGMRRGRKNSRPFTEDENICRTTTRFRWEAGTCSMRRTFNFFTDNLLINLSNGMCIIISIIVDVIVIEEIELYNISGVGSICDIRGAGEFAEGEPEDVPAGNRDLQCGEREGTGFGQKGRIPGTLKC